MHWSTRTASPAAPAHFLARLACAACLAASVSAASSEFAASPAAESVSAASSEFAASATAEPLYLRLLHHATLLAGATLLALLLLVPKKTGTVTELPADPAFTLREDGGVTKVCPVHTGRAKKDGEPPILEGTSRALDNYANPRGLSFLPPRPEGAAAARRSKTPP